MQTYFIKDKEYHLHYTIGRMEQLEKILGNAITGVMVSITNGKYPTISELCTLFACKHSINPFRLSIRQAVKVRPHDD